MDTLTHDNIRLRFSDGIAQMTVWGRIDRPTMKATLDWFMALSREQDSYRMMARIDHFEFPSFGAFREEMSRLGDVFGWIKAVDRCAVLSDKAWIRAGAWLEGAVLPGLSVKTFGLEEDDAAMAWLTEA